MMSLTNLSWRATMSLTVCNYRLLILERFVAKKATQSAPSDTKVTRIKASDDTPSAATKKPVASASETTNTTKTKRKKPTAKGIARPFTAIGRYFAGSWYELKQVRWPTRGATWSLTLAVLAYSAFFVLIVLALDAVFKMIFDLIMGK